MEHLQSEEPFSSDPYFRSNNNHEKCAGIGLNGCISKKLNKNYDITKNLGTVFPYLVSPLE